MRKIISLLIVLLVSLCIFGCSKGEYPGDSSCPEDIGGTFPSDPSPSDPLYGRYDEISGDGFDIVESSKETTDGEKPNLNVNLLGLKELNNCLKGKYTPVIVPSQLTASMVDDNEDYTYWLSLLSKGQEEKNGIFHDYHELFKFEKENRLHIKIEGAKNAIVEIVNDGYTTYTDTQGNAYLYPLEVKEAYDIKITYLDQDGETKTVEKTVADEEVINLGEDSFREDQIELMFVIDTTGSMGDELAYLKAEIENVIDQVKENNPNTKILLSLLFYRDDGDVYVTRYYDFTTDIAKQKEYLAKEKASGGGDFPEAVHKAFEIAKDAQWSSGSSTKLLFHVADAPCRDKYVTLWRKYAYALANKGVKIISVASSGINKMTEYCYRAQSLITGGKYVYLTDDSGIGNGHLEADTREKPVVEYLNALLIRLIDGYHNGEFKEPIPYDGSIELGDLPEQMPSDFSFEIAWKGEQAYRFDLATKTYYTPEGEYQIEFEQKKVEYIYKTLNKFNLNKVTRISKSEYEISGGVCFKISYEQVEKVIYFNPGVYTKYDSEFSKLMYYIVANVVLNLPETNE